MIGVDITSIKRFENKKSSFIKKVLSSDEIRDWLICKDKNLFIAQRWAIKEAIFKANNEYHDFSKINLKRSDKGNFIFKNFLISTSKEKDLIIAFVIEKGELK